MIAGIRRGAVWTCALIIGLMASAAIAQQENGQSSNGSAPDGLDSVTSPLNAAIYLEGPEGPIFVPNVTLQELQEYKESQAGVRGAPYQFTRIEIGGTVYDNYLDLQGAFEVELGPRTQKADIPLKFGSCQIGVNEPIIDSSGTVSQFDADASGYRWKILALADASEATSRHKITLAGKTRITRESDRRAIRIPLPQYPSRLTFMLPPGAQDIRARQDEVVEEVRSTTGVEVTVDSGGGDFTLSWRETTTVAGLSSVEAESSTSFTVVDLVQPWRATTNLKLDWYGSDSPSVITVTLPANSQWRVLPQSGFGRYSITSMNPKELEIDAPEGSAAILQIENFDPSETASINVQLEWIWSPQTQVIDKLSTRTKIAIPSISGVSSHSGTVDCTYQSQFSALFQTGVGTQLLGLRRLSDGTGNQQLRFSFTRQDLDIGLTFRKEESAPTVRPTYLVEVDRNKLVMTAWLACSFDLNHRIQLGINFGDWRIQENTARVLANPDDLLSTKGDLLTVTTERNDISILRGRIQDLGTSSRTEQLWKVVAEKSWTPDENGELEFRVPVISRFQVGGGALVDHTSGALIVSGADNLALQWDDVQSSGLLADSFSTEYQRYTPAASMRSPVAYRFQARGTTPTWSGKATPLPQVVTANQTDQVKIGFGALEIEQEFRIRVANMPLQWLQLDVPQIVIDAGIQVELDGTPIATRPLDPASLQQEAPDPAASETMSRIELLGLPELLGDFRLVVRCSLATDDNTGFDGPVFGLDDQPRLPFVRLVMPQTQSINRRLLGYSASDGIQATLDSESRVIDREGELYPIGPNAPVSARVLQASDPDSLAEVRVNRSWLQTAIDGDQRRDRFVAEVSTTSDQIYFYLPEKAYARNPKPQIILDGVPLAGSQAEYDASQDRYIVRLDDSAEEQKHVLEVFYSVRNSLSSWATLEIYPPTIQDAEFTGRFYWHLATPKTTHLLWSPSELTDEWRWKWGGLFWRRDSVRSESALVDMFGAYDWEQLPLSVNQYLMSGRFPTQPLKPTVVARFVIWFPIGCLAIGLATLVVSYPGFRNPIYGFLLAGIIISFGMLAPDVGILLGQTAVVAVGLVVLVLTTQAAIESRVRRRSVFSNRSFGNGDASGQHSQVQPASGSLASPATTEKFGSSVAATGSGK